MTGRNIMGAGIGPTQAGVKGAGATRWPLEFPRERRHIGGMMQYPLAKFDITREEIERVVARYRFVAAVRAHPMLGPVFAAHVTDWPAHEDKVVRFWANAILGDRVYDGSPMAAHVAAGNVRPGMFGAWLDLFDATLAADLPPETAAKWSALAHRIGRSLRAGVVGRDRLPGGIPNLRPMQ